MINLKNNSMISIHSALGFFMCALVLAFVFQTIKSQQFSSTLWHRNQEETTYHCNRADAIW